MEIDIQIDGGKLLLASPYHPDFPAEARKLGGRFDRDGGKTWVFDARDEDRVRALCVRIFGTDGSPAELVTIRLDPERLAYGESEIWLCGRKIAWRPGRDDEVRLGDGVILISGGFPGSGGSRQYPRLQPKAGTILEIRDLPAAHPDLENPDDSIEILNNEAADRASLQAEKDRLLARIAEIDKALAGI